MSNSDSAVKMAFDMGFGYLQTWWKTETEDASFRLAFEKHPEKLENFKAAMVEWLKDENAVPSRIEIDTQPRRAYSVIEFFFSSGFGRANEVFQQLHRSVNWQTYELGMRNKPAQNLTY